MPSTSERLTKAAILYPCTCYYVASPSLSKLELWSGHASYGDGKPCQNAVTSVLNYCSECVVNCRRSLDFRRSFKCTGLSPKLGAMEGFDMKIGIPYNQQGPDFHRYLFVAAFKHVEHWVERAKVVGILKQQEIPTPPRILISWRGRSSQRDTEPRFMVNFDVKTDVPSSDIKLRQSCIHLVLLCITGNLPGTTFLPGAFWRVAVSIVQRCGEKSLAEEHDLISKVNEISEAMELSRRLT